MHGVSLDEAWGMASNNDPSVSPTSSRVEQTQQTSAAPRNDVRNHEGRRATTKASARVSEVSAPKTTTSSDGAWRELRDAFFDVSHQLRQLRKDMERQQHFHSTILYVAIGIVLLLLVVTLQTCSKLHHTTECLLWIHRDRMVDR